MKLSEMFAKFSEVKSEKVKVIGESDIDIDGLNLCNRKTSKQSVLSYVTNEKYLDIVRKNNCIKALITSQAYVELYGEIIGERNGSLIVSQQPEKEFYRLHEFLWEKTDFYKKYEFEPKIGKECKIDNTAVIEKGVIIGERVTIGPLSIVKSGSIIDTGVTIGCNSVIGSEGFQVIQYTDASPMHITHVGRCHICSNVYIGDNTCICNSLFEGETYVGRGTKIDNLVYVAHNLHIGENVVITAHVILCGSSIVEDNVWIAPNASVLNKITIGKGAKVGMGSVVTKNVAPYTVVYGNPAKVHN